MVGKAVVDIRLGVGLVVDSQGVVRIRAVVHIQAVVRTRAVVHIRVVVDRQAVQHTLGVGSAAAALLHYRVQLKHKEEKYYKYSSTVQYCIIIKLSLNFLSQGGQRGCTFHGLQLYVQYTARLHSTGGEREREKMDDVTYGYAQLPADCVSCTGDRMDNSSSRQHTVQ